MYVKSEAKGNNFSLPNRNKRINVLLFTC